MRSGTTIEKIQLPVSVAWMFKAIVTGTTSLQNSYCSLDIVASASVVAIEVGYH